jgi:hypothetical protein
MALPKVALPLEVKVVVAIMLAKVPVPPEEFLSASSVTTPKLSLKYNLPSVMFNANSPLAKLALSGTAAAVVLLYSASGVNPGAAMFIPCLICWLFWPSNS